MTNIIIPSDPKTRKAIFDAINELSVSMTRIDSERELMKDIVEETSSRTEVPKKYITKMAKIYHNQSMAEVKAENSDLEELYEAITGK
jgi:hypothetical protein